MAKSARPYGSWASPVTTDRIVEGVVRFGDVRADGKRLTWTEQRPSEAGRSVVVAQDPGGAPEDLLSPPWNARTRAHEYGGGAYLMHEGVLLFSNFADQRLYRCAPEGPPEPLTPELPLRFADGIVDPARRCFLYVREDHRGEGEPVAALVAIPEEGGAGEVLEQGFDFYAAPRLSPDGRRLAWICWNHPNMPWDDTELWAADVGADGRLERPHRVAGGPGVSVIQPRWSPAGVLHFVSDESGWWNLHRLGPSGVEALCPRAAEFGSPAWVFGQSDWAFLSEESILSVVNERGRRRLARLDVPNGALSWIDLPYDEVASVDVGDGFAALSVTAPDKPTAVARYDLETGDLEIVRRSPDLELDPGDVSVPRAIEYASAGGRKAHAFYYPPANAKTEGPAGEKPPLLVLSHGGPTSQSHAEFALAKLYWTSRGFALLDVNYGGSTGYGRAYRELLRGNWGVVDVEDCIHGARFLAEEGEVDPDRLAIRGGSAGGYTTLAALTFHEVFTAGASHYGVSDLEALAKDTHKFESRYLDGLVGPYPEAKAVYVERSPIHHAERLSCPVILLQGLEDPVVPPNQAERMLEILRSKGIPVAYVPFEGEQHGFRKASSIRRALEAELYFYGKIFGFEPADEIEPVPIEGL